MKDCTVSQRSARTPRGSHLRLAALSCTGQEQCLDHTGKGLPVLGKLEPS